MENSDRSCLKGAIAAVNPAVLEGQLPDVYETEKIERSGVKSGGAVTGRQLHPLRAIIACNEAIDGCTFDCRLFRTPPIAGHCLLETTVEIPDTD